MEVKYRSPLISTEELLASIDNPHTKIYDVRGTWSTPARALQEDYIDGHIPGAVFLDWTREFIEPGLPVDLAPVASRESALKSFKELGIGKDDLVVLYDDNHHMLAGRIWWAMRYWGFDNVKVLNGGWHRWVAEGHELSKSVSTADIGTFVPVQRKELRVSMEEFQHRKETSCVMDGRGPKGYAGNADDERSGHIPGTVSIPFSLTLDENSGSFHDKSKLIALFDHEIPGWRDSNLISSCGAGYSGTVLMLALSELGVDSTLFDDSFSVWKQDPSRPVERGESSTHRE